MHRHRFVPRLRHISDILPTITALDLRLAPGRCSPTIKQPPRIHRVAGCHMAYTDIVVYIVVSFDNEKIDISGFHDTIELATLDRETAESKYMEHLADYLDDPRWAGKPYEALDLKRQEDAAFAQCIERFERRCRLAEIPL
jgi:hypothetical protein